MAANNPAETQASDGHRVAFPLHLYARLGDLEGIELLLKDLGKEAAETLKLGQDERGELPFHCAARFGSTKVLEAVLPGKDVNDAMSRSGMSALHLAAALGRVEAVEWLLAKSADVNVQNQEMNTPLHLAVLVGEKDVVKILVNNKANLCIHNKHNMMPVSYCQHKDMFQALLSFPGLPKAKRETTQIDVTRKDAGGRSILHYAAQYAADWNTIATLISQKDADLQLRDGEGDAFLHVAAKAGNMEALEALKKLGPHVDIQLLAMQPHTSLSNPGLLALFHDHRKFFDGLVDVAEVEVTLKSIVCELKCDNKGMSKKRLDLFASTLPTYLALFAKRNTVFEFLLETTTITVNQVDDRHKRTCLHWAVVDKRKDIVEKLSHMMPNLKDGDGKTAMQHAFEHKDSEIMEILMGKSSSLRAFEENLFKDRDVHAQALNAILVGAALIASVTLGGWLQLPSHAYTTPSMKVFWASNSLSFFLAVATMCVGIGSLIPTPRRSLVEIVNHLRFAIVLAASLLALSLAAVVCAFSAAGFAALEPSHVSQYHLSMWGTITAGGFICIFMWLSLLVQLVRSIPSYTAILETLLEFIPLSKTCRVLSCVTLGLNSPHANLSRDQINYLMPNPLKAKPISTLHAHVDGLPIPARNIASISEMKKLLSGMGVKRSI